MAINKNHEFEDLNGIKCAIVEKNVLKQRADFLKELLELNGFTVVMAPSPPPKALAVTASAEGRESANDNIADKVETYTVGVTNAAFNAVNAVFGRMLKTKNGRIVTQAYWLQQETESTDSIPYFSLDENIHSWK